MKAEAEEKAAAFLLPLPVFFMEREVQKMSNRRIYRRILILLTILSIITLGVCSWRLIDSRIPDFVQVSKSGEELSFFHNFLDQWIAQEDCRDRQSEVKEASAPGQSMQENTYQVQCSLFGKIPLKTVSVEVKERKKIYAGGIPVGIYLETAGVLVVDTGDITDKDGKNTCPARNIIKSGDYIQAVDGESVSTKEELITCIGKSRGSEIILDVQRAGELISLKVMPVQDESGAYRAGIWVRNDTQGIGTLTYMEGDGKFGALGHGISDVDTGELLDVRGGTLYEADVVSVIKGKQGIPGEVAGVIHYSEGYQIGQIKENRKDGLYGTVTGVSALTAERPLLEIGYRQEVEPGPATILCAVDGTCREYEIEIKELRLNGEDINKGMVLEVTDQELLEKTGGIIQGMSGSPILQNGRIIGAVTHVFVNDPTKGYGIFIENMLEH